MTPVEIVKATARDFESIAALDRVGWRDNAHSEFVPDGEHTWRIWCEHALVWIARDTDGRVLGVILAFPCMSGEFCLHKVLVAGEARGLGLASRLFDALLMELDQLGVGCFLTVDPANTKAIGLYQKWGFREDALVMGFYRSNEDRWVMVRSAGTGA